MGGREQIFAPAEAFALLSAGAASESSCQHLQAAARGINGSEPKAPKTTHRRRRTGLGAPSGDTQTVPSQTGGAGVPSCSCTLQSPRRSQALCWAPNRVHPSGFHHSPLPGTAPSQKAPRSGPAWDLRAVPWPFAFSSPSDAAGEPVRGQPGSDPALQPRRHGLH